MTRPVQHSRDLGPAAGLLLVRGEVPEVSVWIRRGVVPVTVAPLEGWTGVIPRGRSKVQAPYDDVLMMLAARRLPRSLRPAIGLFVIKDRAVITVHRGGPRRMRWVIWDPAEGVVRPPGLRQASPSHVLGVARGGDRTELLRLLAERQLPPGRLLAVVADTLGLPGGEILARPDKGSSLVGAVDRDPDAVQIGYFEDAVKDAVQLRRELEQT